ncbi:hypothetical protein KORDIASMS9_02270 [Kordia sp. SMS9]|uniref:hypothetical protein n=1 Tax=Kordia sp. SMS9 TaxID=2282170 RepID=UPI000E0D5054|nr:hypothetical protein [Kordia sp. SMS9]AXG70041.1 hypothetical protein KORDIASMS9_02270 [Kordia sp. SMS9]
METQTSPPIQSIQQWNAIRLEGSLETIQSIFDKAGNYFFLDTGNMSTLYNRMHLYLGYDNENLQVYAVSDIADNVDNLQQAFSGYQHHQSQANNPVLSGIEQYVDLKLVPSTLSTVNQDIIDRLSNKPELVVEINNWNTYKNDWAAQAFQSKTILQAFKINTADFIPEDIHACFFALKGEEGSFEIDLVIVSTGLKEIGQMMKNKEPYTEQSIFEDLARPVPPFDPTFEGMGIANIFLQND